MNRTEREMKSDWEDSWERSRATPRAKRIKMGVATCLRAKRGGVSIKNRGNGFTSAQIFLIILAVLLAAALIGILVLYFFL